MTDGVELLSPAGDFETALAAFAYGADAVYCGLQDYSARAFAKNLSTDELRNLLRVAHAPERTRLGGGRKVYITFNTLVDANGIPDAASRLAELESLGVDGIIVQDLGIAKIAREHFPGLELHASTQLVAHNLEGVLALKDLGFKRVVLARETSLAEVESIVRRCGVEIECFIHGALCYSLSGLCLYSAMEHGRSGNRGRCAYSCRSACSRENCQAGHPFSMKDLRLGEDARRLAQAGVKSLKIEGRMKSPLYVASVTKYYREILDGVHPRTVTEADLETVFSRETTKLYFEGLKAGRESGVDGVPPGHVGARIGAVKRITRDREGRRWLRFHTIRALEKHDGIQFAPHASDDGGEKREGFGITLMRKAISRAPVFEVAAGEDVELLLPDEGFANIRQGDDVFLAMSNAVKNKFPLPSYRPGDWPGTRVIDIELRLARNAITAKAGDCEVAIEGDFTPANNPAATLEACKKAFSRLGESDYRLGELHLDDPDRLFAPMSVLNDLRRRLVRKCCQCENVASTNVNVANVKMLPIPNTQYQLEIGNIGTGDIFTLATFLKLRFGQTEPDGEWQEKIVEIASGLKPDALGPVQNATRLALPVYTPEAHYGALRALVKGLLHRGWKRWEAADLAGVRMLRSLGVEDISADWTLYAFNACALEALAEYGVKRFVASPENSQENLDFLARSGYDVEFLERQSTPLFISLNEPAGGTGFYKTSDSGEIAVFEKNGLFITTRPAPRRFYAPEGCPTRIDISWDADRI